MASAREFDDENPWHTHFFVMLEARCDSCGQLGDTADLAAKLWKRQKKSADALVRYCVEASERLQKEGWQFTGESKFTCPACSRSGNTQCGGG